MNLDPIPGPSGMTAPPLDLRATRGLEGLEALRDDWNAVAATLTDPGFHHQHDWHANHLRCLQGNPDDTWFFTFAREGRAVAIFPLRRTRRVIARVPLRAWELPSSAHMTLGDALIAPGEDATVLLQGLAQRLAGQRATRRDALHFPNVLADSTLGVALDGGALPRTCGISSRTSMHFDCPDLETAMRNCSTDFRRNLRRQLRKLQQRGRLDFCFHRQRDDVLAALPRFFELEASGWKGAAGEGTAIREDSQLVDFYRGVAESFAVRGRCAINELRLDGVPVAAHFALVAGRTMYLLKIAYDETLRAEAPGAQLLHAVLEHCCASAEIDRLSLVTGPEWARDRWKPEQRPLSDISAFDATPAGLLALSARSLRPVASSAARVLRNVVRKEHAA